MSESLETRLRTQAEAVGFTLFGIAPATDADGFDRFAAWLDAGFAGEMDYLHEYREHRRHPRAVLASVRSVVMLGMEYAECGTENAECGMEERSDNPHSALPTPHSGRIAKYALGPDYHRYIWDRVNALSAWLVAEVPGSAAHGVTDSAPLLERDFARRAGLGWFGKNTLLINKHRGSFFFLAALLTDITLSPSPPHEATHCGTCTACLEACPTQAFPAPGVLDARKCISYLTIELRGPMPEELRPPVGDWLFGCDVCQDVCPWNGKRPHPPSPSPSRRGGVQIDKAKVTREAFAERREEEGVEHPLSGTEGEVSFPFPSNPDLLALDPLELLGLTRRQFKRRFAGTSLLRARRGGLLRNAAIVLGNTGNASALPALERAATDADPVVRDAAAWAIARIRARVTPDNPGPT